MSATFDPGYTTVSSPVPDRLIAGNLHTVTDTVTFAQRTAKYVRGELLGQITSSSKFTGSLSAASDGSQVPQAVCVDEVDASGGDVVGGVYFTGEFNALVMTFGASHTAASVKAGLRARGIFLKTNLQP